MCGRYLLHADPDLLERAFGVELSQSARDLGRPLLPRYNIAPTQRVPIIRDRTEGPKLNIIRRADGTADQELVVARWGLIFSWAKDPVIGN
jgi:putative SOS response-associated peptidase YedK